MKIITESRIDGDFLGMRCRSSFTLENGERWRQVGDTFASTFIYRPRAAVIEDSGRHFLHVQGFTHNIEVRKVD